MGFFALNKFSSSIYFFYFLHEQKVAKILGFRKIHCRSKPEVLSRNTRHDRLVQFRAFVVAVYCYAHAIRTYLRQEPLMYFSNAGPANINFPYGQYFGVRIWLMTTICGVWRPA
jgi:hypothetical protein